MPTTAEVKDDIRRFLQQQFAPAREAGFSDSDSLLKPGLIDSFGVLELMTFLEQHFGVTLSDDEMLSERFESINSLAELVSEKLPTGG
jgi:acyl carrier protein